jgi:hypothetical protein
VRTTRHDRRRASACAWACSPRRRFAGGYRVHDRLAVGQRVVV